MEEGVDQYNKLSDTEFKNSLGKIMNILKMLHEKVSYYYATSFLKGTVIKYKTDVVDMILNWIEENDKPEILKVPGRKFTLIYGKCTA